MSTITILHTNDLHNRLNRASAEIIRSAKERTDAIVLDAGDAVWAGNVYFRPGGEPVLDLMSWAGYDAMAVGNREFHFSRMGFESKISRASHTILCSNVRSSDGAELPCRPSVVLTRCGVRVGVFGLTVPMITPRSQAAHFSAFVFDNPLEAAPAVVQSLRGECDLVVALTHIGLPQDRRLAEGVPGIDLIVGGHSHDCLQQAEVVNGVPIVQAGAHGHYYGVVEVTGEPGGWSPHARLEPLKAVAQ